MSPEHGAPAPIPTPTAPEASGAPAAPAPAAPAGASFEAITSQEQLDAILQPRLARAKPADYDDVKAQLAALQDKDRTDLERANLRAEAAEKSAAELTRTAVAATKGVPAALLVGATQAELEASADELLAFRGPAADPADPAAVAAAAAAAAAASKVFPNPAQHGNPAPGEDEAREAFARQLFAA